MKKYLLVVLCLLISTTSYSQKVLGSFSLPESEKFLDVKWDWSKAVIDKKLTEKEWAIVVGENDWEQAKLEALQLITREMNEKLENSRIMVIAPGSEKKTACTLFITPISYNKKGFNVSQYILINNQTGNQVGICEIKGDGGKIGSVGNLLGDGYEESARKIGTILKKYNKVKKIGLIR